MPDMHAELSPEDIQTVLSTVDIPSCPKIVMDTMREIQKDDPNVLELARLITADAGMSAAAFKLANSSAYSRGNPVSSVKSAIDRLGLKNLGCVVVASALRKSYEGVPAHWMDQFWQRAMQVAQIAYAIARRQYGISPDAAFTYALFHNAAIPLMVRRFPNYLDMLEAQSAQNALLIDAESSLYPCTHPVVGFLLAKSWGLPVSIGQAIRFHHDPEAYELPDKLLPGGAIYFTAITQIAEHLHAELRDERDLEVGPDLYARACAYLGLSDEDVDVLTEVTRAILEET